MSTISPLFPDKYHKIIYCQFEEQKDRWKCSRCQNFIKKHNVGDKPPYSVCRVTQLDSVSVQSEPLPGQNVVNRSNIYEEKKPGPGTILKGILYKFGIKASSGCSCNAKARIMDEKGIEWCENNIDTIVGWLRDEAHKRNLPFINSLAKILVKKAIKDAKKQ